ncbi:MULTISPECIES: hypothetical protein [unclassified Corallococcus]|uniref:hypothetical protein n=1 Tax=unclassified Corallococcus TaxID=2685029 RepID=UPI001A8FB5BC|nr:MULTISPECIES: hypothetical protein [unclassified Corallococcus]MBN9684645.1 hypothetical protein [Corallococcus sp. NCSPR001]WAS83884.1 hypothetical protein O0N60_31850 [Corallococcus sp. NCRR]
MRRLSSFIVLSSCLAGGLLSGCGDEPSARAPAEPTAQQEQKLLALVSCPVGAVVTNYSPPLRSTPQAVTIQGQATFSNCVSVFDPGLTSATNNFTINTTAYTCNDLLEIGSARTVVTWNTGETSTLVQTRVSSQVGSTTIVITYVGTVESGKYRGAVALRTLTYLSTDLDACTSPEGLTQMSGLTTLTLLGLP